MSNGSVFHWRRPCQCRPPPFFSHLSLLRPQCRPSFRRCCSICLGRAGRPTDIPTDRPTHRLQAHPTNGPTERHTDQPTDSRLTRPTYGQTSPDRIDRRTSTILNFSDVDPFLSGRSNELLFGNRTKTQDDVDGERNDDGDGHRPTTTEKTLTAYERDGERKNHYNEWKAEEKENKTEDFSTTASHGGRGRGRCSCRCPCPAETETGLLRRGGGGELCGKQNCIVLVWYDERYHQVIPLFLLLGV